MKQQLRRLTFGLFTASLLSFGLVGVANASPAPSDATVTSVVESALKIDRIPAKTTPSLSLVSSDSFYKFNAKCAAGKGGCIFGKRSSKKVMYVFGDSHAQQWLPPLVGAFGAKYKIVVAFRLECQPAEVDVESTPGQPSTTGCSSWRAKTIQKIIKAKPKVIVVAESTFGRKSTDGAIMSTATWSTGLLSVLTQLKSSDAKVVLIGDNPAFQVKPSDCLAQNSNNVQTCTWNPTTQPAEYQILSAAEANAASVSGVGYIDTTKWFCKVTPSQTSCPALINGMLPYVDSSQITLTYSRYLTTVLKTAVTNNLK
ncbi:MAG: SGNH hydrolase domain-containing protein [Actinomycetes bacterium]